MGHNLSQDHDLYIIYRKEPISITLTLAIISTLLSCIVFCTSVYYQRKFMRLRKHPFIRKRHPLLVFWFSLILSVFILVERTLSVLIRCGIYSQLWFQWIRWILFVIFLRSASFALLLRLYLLFFNIQWTKSNDSNRWKYYINKRLRTKPSFFIKYHSTLGNLLYIYKYVILCLVITVIICVLLLTTTFTSASIVDFVLHLVECILMAILWFSTPVFHDEFFIQLEIKYTLITFSLLLAHYTIYIIYGILFGETLFSWYTTHIITMAFLTTILMFAIFWPLSKYDAIRGRKGAHKRAFTFNFNAIAKIDENNDNGPMYISVTITDVIKEEIGFECFMNHLAKEFSMENLLAIVEMTQYKERFKELTKLEDIYEGHELEMDDDEFKGKAALFDKATKLRDSLRDSLKNKVVDTLHDFIKKRTFNSETNDSDATDSENESISDEIDELCVDSKKVTMDSLVPPSLALSPKLQNSPTSLIDVKDDIIEFPHNIPQSTLVYGDEHKAAENAGAKNKDEIKLIDKYDECRRIVHELYKKYIFVGSEMELNLSSGLRARCVKKFDRINEMYDDALFHIFDKCILALLQLMQDSYRRFQSTPGFKEYELKLKRKKAKHSSSKSADSQTTSSPRGGLIAMVDM